MLTYYWNWQPFRIDFKVNKGKYHSIREIRDLKIYNLWLFGFTFAYIQKLPVEYYTTDTEELAPYPDMTSDDLREFEEWAMKTEQQAWIDVKSICLCILLPILLFAIVVLVGCHNG